MMRFAHRRAAGTSTLRRPALWRLTSDRGPAVLKVLDGSTCDVLAE